MHALGDTPKPGLSNVHCNVNSPENTIVVPSRVKAFSAIGATGDAEGSDTVKTPPSTFEGSWIISVAKTPGDSSLSLPSLLQDNIFVEGELIN